MDKRALRLPADDLDVGAFKGMLGQFLAEWAWQERQSPQKDVVLQRVLEAEKLTRESLAVAAGQTNQNTNAVATARIYHGAALEASATLSPTLNPEERHQRFAEAEHLLRTGREQRVEPEIEPYSTNRRAIEWLIRLNEAWEVFEPGTGKAAQATKWQAELAAFDREASANAIPAGVQERKESPSP